jgi:DNA gyrase/topoisomerase IV subunit A
MSENRYDSADVESLQHSLEMLSAAIAATDRHVEVLNAIAGASDKVHARAAVATLLSLTDDQADMVLNLQWYRVTSEAREELRRHRGDVEEVLRRRRASSPEHPS